MKTKEVKITIASVAKLTFVVMTGYKLGKTLFNFVNALEEAMIKAGIKYLDEKTPVKVEVKEEETDS